MRFILHTFIFITVLSLPTFVEASTLSQPPNNLGLVGYWSFNEGAGTQAGDFSGNGNDGTFGGSTSWVSGKLGSAVSTGNSTSDKVTTDVDIGSNWTATAWFKYPLTGTGSGWWTLFRGSSDHQVLVSRSSNELGVYDNGGTSFNSSSFDMTTLSEGWHHITVVGSGSVQNFYIDGAFVGQASYKSTSDIQTIGNCPCDNQNWGTADEIRIYNRALSESEIVDLYQSGSVSVNTSRKLENIDGLQSWWTFDGQSINDVDGIADDSGNGNHAQFKGGATSSATVLGRLGQALEFDGVDDYVDTGYQVSSQEMTISGWIKPNGAFTGTLFTEGVIDSGVRFRMQEASGKLRWQCYNGQWYTTTSDSVIPANDWTFFAATMSDSAGELALYIDGEKQSTPNTDITGCSDHGSLYIGTYIWPLGDVFDGVMDDLRVYNRRLTDREIKRIYNATRPAEANTTRSTGSLNDGLVGFWTFDGPDFDSTDGVLDTSGNSNHGQFSGGATSSAKTIGKLGQALEFDGVDDYVDTGNDPSLSPGTGDITTSAWIYMENIQDSQTGVLRALGSNKYYMMTIGSRIQFEFRDDSNENGGNRVAGSANTNIPLNQWNHISVTFDRDGVATFYLNGETDGIIDISSAQKSITGVAGVIGKHVSNFNGKIDNARIYNRALSAEEVKRLYNLGR